MIDTSNMLLVNPWHTGYQLNSLWHSWSWYYK